MRVEVVKAFSQWSVGQVFEDMPPNQATALIARGLVRRVEEKAVASTFNRMMRSRVQK